MAVASLGGGKVLLVAASGAEGSGVVYGFKLETSPPEQGFAIDMAAVAGGDPGICGHILVPLPVNPFGDPDSLGLAVGCGAGGGEPSVVLFEVGSDGVPSVSTAQVWSAASNPYPWSLPPGGFFGSGIAAWVDAGADPSADVLTVLIAAPADPGGAGGESSPLTTVSVQVADRVVPSASLVSVEPLEASVDDGPVAVAISLAVTDLGGGPFVASCEPAALRPGAEIAASGSTTACLNLSPSSLALVHATSGVSFGSALDADAFDECVCSD